MSMAHFCYFSSILEKRDWMGKIIEGKKLLALFRAGFAKRFASYGQSHSNVI